MWAGGTARTSASAAHEKTLPVCDLLSGRFVLLSSLLGLNLGGSK